jgi:hypothetical protein
LLKDGNEPLVDSEGDLPMKTQRSIALSGNVGSCAETPSLDGFPIAGSAC